MGRGGPEQCAPHPGLQFIRIRPGSWTATGPLGSRHISRVQLLVRSHALNCIEFRNVGRCEASVIGSSDASGYLRPGDHLKLGERVLLACGVRPMWLPELRGYPGFEFGAPDLAGVIGETPQAWEIRRRIALAARESGHVLIRGGSGTGKELAARAIHLLSARGNKPMVARNAATFPETLIDAELFGNTRNYPNPGMPERPGLIGEADGSTLLLDEIGELPHGLQAHLLRVLDGGEYQRLGEASSRRADVRVIAATNRELDCLKHDLVARFKIRVNLPELDARSEDLPLLARHLLKDSGRTLTPEQISRLLRHQYSAGVREFETLLRELALGDDPLADPPDSPKPRRPRSEFPSRSQIEQASIGEDEIRHALREQGGRQERVWRALGLSSRHALRRLMRKYGIEP